MEESLKQLLREYELTQSTLEAECKHLKEKLENKTKEAAIYKLLAESTKAKIKKYETKPEDK